ncbi:solute carrier organic anion transporter family member 6A1-like isoform X1 [Mesocricetus auratus]|uniref:Solute carrier organic anion transporter family member n=2 Tax=Mesocricetus auratus TaxID=10036 RepID=A0ABM2Y1D0_MESAU|nr:solute carrier organic anion transporter family member 6A1-like isoform X1 [Mesocricetus auratus]
MTEEPGNKKDAKNTAPETEGDGMDQVDLGPLIKITPYLKTLPTAVGKFRRLHLEKSPDSSSPPKLPDPQLSTSLEGPFGLGPLVFPAFQRFNNIDFFTFWYFLLVTAHGAVFALVDYCLKKIDKEFSLSEKERLIMDYSDYHASFLVAVLIAHYGGRGNRSKWMAASAFILGIASIIFALIFYKYEIIKPVEKSEELCIEEQHRTMSGCRALMLPHRTECIHLFILGQYLHGITGMPLYILGVTFIFDHVPTFSAGLYLAICDAAQLLGYLLGFVISSWPPPQHGNPNEDENEIQFRKFQQNWWSGFFSVAVLSWCTFLPLLCFPCRLPGAHKLRFEKEKEPPSFDKRLKNKEYGPSLKDMVQTTKCLLKNPLLICYSLCKTTESLTFKGSMSFVPIYLQNQFLITPSVASMLTGLILIPGLAIGHFVGGLIVDRLEMSCKNKIRFTVVTSTIALVLFILILFVECETVKFAGINEDYDGSGNLGNLTAPCNEKCACPSSIYASVCGRDDTEYFSPCFAGCRASKFLHNEKAYYNCSCIKQGLTNADTEGDFVDAVSGKCSNKCHTLPLFFAFFFSSILFSNLSSIPVTITILQSAPANLNSLSLGITYTIWRIGGSIFAPLAFDVSIARACIYWNINECGIKERCWIHNKSKMVYIVMGLCVFFQSSTALLGLFALSKYDSVVNASRDCLVHPVMEGKEGKEEKT